MLAYRQTDWVVELPEITTLASLLDALGSRGADKEERQAFDEAVWKERGGEAAILVTDLSGFTRLTKKHGILHFLHVFRRCKDACLPIVEKWNGTLMKEEADDLIVIFDKPLEALAAAIEMQRVTIVLNESLHEDDRVHMCIGIEFGGLLRLDDDAFGDTVNVAFKLGEDVADKGEVLLGPNVFRIANEEGFDFSDCIVSDELVVETGNVPIAHFSVRLR